MCMYTYIYIEIHVYVYVHIETSAEVYIHIGIKSTTTELLWVMNSVRGLGALAGCFGLAAVARARLGP